MPIKKGIITAIHPEDAWADEPKRFLGKMCTLEWDGIELDWDENGVLWLDGWATIEGVRGDFFFYGIQLDETFNENDEVVVEN